MNSYTVKTQVKSNSERKNIFGVKIKTRTNKPHIFKFDFQTEEIPKLIFFEKNKNRRMIKNEIK